MWKDRDLSQFAGSVRVKGTDLQVELVARGQQRLMKGLDAPFQDLWHGPIAGETEDGWRFAARTAVTTNWTMHTAAERSEIVELRALDWTFARGSEQSPYWVAEVGSKLPVYVGNLELSTGASVSRGHYFLSGPECDYALVSVGREKGRWALVVCERTPHVLTHNVLRRDLNAIAVAFGTPLAVGCFWSVDEELRVHGVLGGDLIGRTQRGMSEEAPVPSTNDLRALPAVFFERFARHLADRTHEEGAALVLASWYYLESISELSADAAVVKMALAATVSARYVLNGNIGLAADDTAFGTWLATNDAQLTLLERQGRSKWLRTQVANAKDATPLTIIHLALEQLGIGIVPPLDAALDVARGYLAGELMPADGFYEHLARLRTIFAAIVARAIGYKGALSGWVKAGRFGFYEPAPEPWWKGDPQLSASFYSADVAVRAEDVAGLWPTVVVPEVPDSGVLGLLARYAGGLASKTDGRVYADLQPLPLDAPRAERRYELALRASQRPSTRITLFVARQAGETVIIEGWLEPATLTSGADAEAFLKRVGNAPETAAAIERLVLASLEAARHGES